MQDNDECTFLSTHEKLVQVHDDVSDSGPGGEFCDIGIFWRWTDGVGGHLNG